ncbi:nuclear envelope integral membrane protein 1a [Chelonus insularis]|uniref:nuclear envelope integral membrane protein 1a n=1 Tax=Chelonus insularis TaxID=460826 RepID=UPI001589C081|nr:nuclear envelope integral membrane protein 1a [Chelonus insularis]
MNFYAFCKFYLLFICTLLIYHVSTQATPTESIHYLQPGDTIENFAPGLRIFCHTAKSKYFIYLWRVLKMNLHTNLDNYDLYDGKSPSEVIEKHDVNQRSWKFNWFNTKKSKSFKINPLEDICLGIYTHPYIDHRYKISMELIKIDVTQVLTTIAGIILFWSAPKLSRNSLFYYLTGICLGVTFSLLILIWFAARLFSQGKTMYLIAGTGWLMSTWLARIVCDNVQMILMQYREYVIGYFLLSSLISFLICYRIGPVTNTRTKQIIQWFLQVSGMVMIYFSSYFREASIGLCILCILIYNFPTVMYHRSKNYWRKMFPKRQKLLTEDEYRIQTMIETSKALGGLQAYCSSPESNPWKIVMRLKDPVRFARFMEGESHLSEDETMQHDLEITKMIEECEYTEDEYEEND